MFNCIVPAPSYIGFEYEKLLHTIFHAAFVSNKINFFGLPEIRMKNKLVYEKKKASKL